MRASVASLEEAVAAPARLRSAAAGGGHEQKSERSAAHHSFGSSDGYSPAEIAALVGKPESTVRSNLRQARRQLMEKLK